MSPKNILGLWDCKLDIVLVFDRINIEYNCTASLIPHSSPQITLSLLNALWPDTCLLR